MEGFLLFSPSDFRTLALDLRLSIFPFQSLPPGARYSNLSCIVSVLSDVLGSVALGITTCGFGRRYCTY